MNYKGQDLKPGSPHTFAVDTPLLFQWLPRQYGYPIPENYLRRLSEWAKREDMRVVKLVINGSGFTLRQCKELEDKISNREFNPNKNIELIDFYELGSVDKILEKPYKSSNKIEKTHKNLSSFIKSGKNAPKIFNFTKKHSIK